MRLQREDRSWKFFSPDGSSVFPEGKQVFRALSRELVELTDLAQDALEDSTNRWVDEAVAAAGLQGQEDVRKHLRRALAAPGASSAHRHLMEVAHAVDRAGKSVHPRQWIEEVQRGAQSARRLRNLINHRRRCVNGVLDCFVEPDFTWSSSRRQRPQQRTSDAIELLERHIGNPHEFGRFVAQAFEVLLNREREERTTPDAILNNYRLEWLEFVHQYAPQMWLDDQDIAQLRRRQDFETRFNAALDELQWRLGEAPQAQADSHWRVVQGAPAEPVSALDAVEQQLAMRQRVASAEPTAARASTPDAAAVPTDWPTSFAQPPQTEAARLEFIRGPQTTTLLINADAFGVRDADDMALLLGLELTDPGDPTPVHVRVLDGVPRRIEVLLHSTQRDVVSRVFTEAKRLLHN